MFVFGGNGYGQLGIGNNLNIYEPKLLMNDPSISKICATFAHSLILKSNGDLFFWIQWRWKIGIE